MSRRILSPLWLFALCASACGTPHDPSVVDRLDCNSCHADLYDSVSVHVERAYPRECYACHGTLDWADVTPTHGRFPIGRGAHRGFDCTECHLSREDRTDITCIDCHEHRSGRAGPFHIGNSAYRFAPRSCFDCHPGG